MWGSNRLYIAQAVFQIWLGSWSIFGFMFGTNRSPLSLLFSIPVIVVPFLVWASIAAKEKISHKIFAREVLQLVDHKANGFAGNTKAKHPTDNMWDMEIKSQSSQTWLEEEANSWASPPSGQSWQPGKRAPRRQRDGNSPNIWTVEKPHTRNPAPDQSTDPSGQPCMNS